MRNQSANPTMRNTIDPSLGQMKRPVVQRLGWDSGSIHDAHGSLSKVLQVAVFGDVAPLVGRKLREWAPDIRCFVGFGGLEAVLASQVPRPDIVVVLPLGGAQAAAVVIARRRWPGAKVLVISSKDRVAGLSRAGAHDSYVGGLGSMLAVGSDLADQVRLLAGANRPRRYQREFEADLPAYPAIELLTAEELSDLIALPIGLGAKGVAEKRGYARKTVRNRLSAAYRKLGVSGDLEVVMLGWTWGFIPRV